MKTLNSIIICSRLSSRRVPGKALKEINGKPSLYHLLDRLIPSGIKIIVAIPLAEREQGIWDQFIYNYEDEIEIFYGSENDPLDRMNSAAHYYGVKHVIRITHDKIFVDTNDIFRMLDVYMKKALDYAYSSTLTPGTGFEIISAKALNQAAHQYKNVEHISYAIKTVTKNQFDVDFEDKLHENIRLLIDFPEDISLMNTVLGVLGNDCTQEEVFEFLDQDWCSKINEMPLLTVYTCAYNAVKFISNCMGSVAAQDMYSKIEYLLIDDHSTDRTTALMSRFAAEHSNAKFIRNGKNIGLASSSNIALKEARGQYIMRLDADDYLMNRYSLEELINEINNREVDVVYPNNYFGDYGIIQRGHEHHHVGGAIFKTRAINHIKFTEALRNYEGLDFFERAKEVLKVGYLNKPTFFYRQHDNSMSKTNLEERERTKEKILNQHLRVEH